jgi:hypothetical protein
MASQVSTVGWPINDGKGQLTLTGTGPTVLNFSRINISLVMGLITTF